MRVCLRDGGGLSRGMQGSVCPGEGSALDQLCRQGRQCHLVHFFLCSPQGPAPQGLRFHHINAPKVDRRKLLLYWPVCCSFDWVAFPPEGPQRAGPLPLRAQVRVWVRGSDSEEGPLRPVPPTLPSCPVLGGHPRAPPSPHPPVPLWSVPSLVCLGLCAGWGWGLESDRQNCDVSETPGPDPLVWSFPSPSPDSLLLPPSQVDVDGVGKNPI